MADSPNTSTLAGQARDPRTRYEGGFDRWSATSRSGWSVLWRGAEQSEMALGDGGTIWVWDVSERIWEQVPVGKAGPILREHEAAIRRLRRANLAVKLLNSQAQGEREAARSALQRIAAAIIADWQATPCATDATADTAWFDHAAAVYQAVTQDCRLHMREQERMPFDLRIFSDLVSAAQEDFAARRRARPPRLRPEVMARLQASIASQVRRADARASRVAPTVAPDANLMSSSESASPAKPARVDRLAELREELSHVLSQELAAETASGQRRYRLYQIGGSMALGMMGLFVILRLI